MTTAFMNAEFHPTVEVTERTDGHFMPFMVGLIMFVASALAFVAMTGVPH